MSSYTRFRAVFISLLLAQLIIPSTIHFNTKSRSIIFIPSTARAAIQNSNIRIKEINPVVNEGNQIKLTAIDANGQELNDAVFESGSTDIASVDAKTGMVRGVERGFATVTARRGNDSVSTFVVVARVEGNRGAKVQGDTKTDTGGRIYISDPLGNVILRKDGTAAAANLFAGSKDVRGRRDGDRTEALFAGPTGVAVDNSAFGGIYVADTLNHSIRKIGFNNQVATILGAGSPGITAALMNNDSVKFSKPEDIFFSSPRGAATDAGGNLFIADTDNHAIYFVDFMKKEVRLLAGEPGASGKADGKGRAARFNRPSGIALKSNGKIIAVADTGNNRVRLITRDGDVTTVGRATSSNRVMEGRLDLLQANDENEFNFTEPQSVSFDGVGNIYVIDKSGAQAQIITFPSNQTVQVVSLAQVGSFNQAVSIVVGGAQTFVLDNNATSEADAVKVVTVGAPIIESVSKESVRIEGGEEVVITGKNFAPESQVVLGDAPVPDAVVESATRIRFRVPPQKLPGGRTLSVRTRGGVVQRVFGVTSKPLSELADGEITTVAGGIAYVGDGGSAVGITSGLSFPTSTSIDGAGNLFIVDSFNNRIRRVDAATGIITTVAGNGNREFSGDAGPAVSAGLNLFSVNEKGQLAIDGAGNLFIADAGNNRIRRVDAFTGVISTVAGSGGFGFRGDGGPALSAEFGIPTGIAVDGAGNLFIADKNNHRIRRVDARTGIVATVAGSGPTGSTGGGFSGDGGSALNARLNRPSSITINEAGDLFIADLINNRIRRVEAATGVITTVAGNGSTTFVGDNVPAVNTGFIPRGIAVDGAGNLFIADSNIDRIYRVEAGLGVITRVAGGGIRGFSGDNGLAVSAGLNLGFIGGGIIVDGAGNLFIADSNNNRIRRVDTTSRIITTVAGSGNPSFSGDNGPAISAGLAPQRVAVDAAGNLFIADGDNNRIRRVDAATGIITTVAGNGKEEFSGDNGLAVNAGLRFVAGAAIDGAGNLFIADRDNGRVRRVDAATGIITTIAGGGNAFGDNIPAINAKLVSPTGIAIDKAGNLFFSDFFDFRVYRVDAASNIITLAAGGGLTNFSGDNGPAVRAGLSFPDGGAVDGAGNLLIADSGNNRVRRVDAATGIITTVAGGGNALGDNVPATDAGLNPRDVAIDGAGNLFIATFSRIRRVDAATGIISTVAGNGVQGFSGDGGPAKNASLLFANGVAVDGAGNLFISDSGTKAVRVVKGTATGISVAPTIAAIADQTVKAGESSIVPVSTLDLNGDAGLKLSLASSLPFVSLTDDGGGKGTILIAPSIAETQGGRVIVQVADQGGLAAQTSFIITVLPNLAITGASFNKPNLIIAGSGFGSSSAKVGINGQDASARIISQTDAVITLKGSKKKLNLKKGANQITVTANGATSNIFVFQLFAE